MTQEIFNALVEDIRLASIDTLMAKNAKYASDGDRLHNFRAGGDVDGSTPAQACWGYMTKHLVALRDMVKRNDFRDLADLREKCQDIINYTVFLYCIGHDEAEKYTREAVNAGD